MSNRDGYGNLREGDVKVQVSQEDDSVVTSILSFVSVLLIIITFPVSIFFCVRMVQASIKHDFNEKVF